MTLKKYILEQIRENLYHFTSPRKLYAILNNNKLNLSINLGTKSDKFFDDDKFYFLSMQRTKSGKLGYARNQEVRIELNKRKLSQRDAIKPVDYWGYEMRQINPQMSDEMEDRLVSTESELSPVSDYILSIDVLMDREKETDVFFKIYELANKLNVDIYFFQDENAFRNQNRNKAIDIYDIESSDKEYEHKPFAIHGDFETLLAFLIIMNPNKKDKHVNGSVSLYEQRWDHVINDADVWKEDNPKLYSELLSKYEKEKEEGIKNVMEKRLDKEVKSMEDQIKYAYGANLTDIVGVISSYIHNVKSTEKEEVRDLLHDIIKEFRSRKIKDITTMIKTLRDNQ